MTRRRLLALGFFTTPLVGIAVACSFPDVSFAPASNDVPETGTRSDATGEADADQLTEASIGDFDANQIDLTSCFECDCDHDGYWRDAGCDAAATDAAGFKGFGDCDDSRDVYHPNQGSVYFRSFPQGAPFAFDFDCSGTDEQLYAAPLTCAFNGPVPALASCVPTNAKPPSNQGTTTPVGCGVEADLAKCEKPDLSNCNVVASGTTATQACH